MGTIPFVELGKNFLCPGALFKDLNRTLLFVLTACAPDRWDSDAASCDLLFGCLLKESKIQWQTINSCST